MGEVLPYNIVDAVISNRDAAMRDMEEAVALIQRGHALARQALNTSMDAHKGTPPEDMSFETTAEYDRLFFHFDADKSMAAFRRQTDIRVWVHLMGLTGMYNLMDKEARDKFRAQLKAEVPEVNRDNLEATAHGLQNDARLIFLRSVANAFSNLDRRFKSHDAFKIGSRIILTNVFTDWGYWNYHSNMRDVFADLERVFAVLDGKTPQPDKLWKKVDEGRQGFGAMQSLTETEYFRIRTFKNGNAHFWFLRDDLVEKANLLLAEYYGEVLPDAVGPTTSTKDFRSKSGALCKDLSFYPTPTKVITQMMGRLYGENLRILEPSAGTGNMVRHLLTKGHRVDAVEVDPMRYQQLCQIRSPKVTVTHANFLCMTPVAEYDAVVMNPPFYGTHYMEHVEHAYRYLKTRGTLLAVLPYTVRLGTTKKHKAFRKWVKDNRGHFYDLPPCSFEESGTRINTVWLEIGK
tara:strand:+ start:30224 stop:31606 length:1383 start_codon:yes stop_codon:yes gene_type:complete